VELAPLALKTNEVNLTTQNTKWQLQKTWFCNYAERKVKPCQDFNGSSQTENHFQCILQVAENSHQTSKS